MTDPTPPQAPAEVPKNPMEFGKDAVGHVQQKIHNLGRRFNRAFKEMREVNGASEKIACFFYGFLAEVREVQTAEDKAKLEAVQGTTDTMLAQEKKTPGALAAAVKTSLVGSEQVAAGSETDNVLGTYATVFADTEKEFDQKYRKEGEKEGSVMTRLAVDFDKLDPAKNPEKKALSEEDKKLVYAFGIEAVINLKSKYPRKVDFLNALNTFDNATKKTIGLEFFKSEAVRAHLKEVFYLGKVEVASLLKNRVGYVNAPILVGKMWWYMYGEQLTKESSLACESIFKEVLPDTPGEYSLDGPSRSRAIHVMSDISNSPTKTATNEQITDLVFAVSDKDLQGLIDLLMG